MKKIFLVILMAAILSLAFEAYAAPMRIGICPTLLMGSRFNYYFANVYELYGMDLHSAAGIDLSISYPIYSFLDIQAGGTYFTQTNPAQHYTDSGIQISSIYLNARMVGNKISSLSGFQPYAGLGINYGFFQLETTETAIHGNIGYQIFVGGYIADAIPVEIGWIHLNGSGSEVDENGFMTGVYLKGGYAFNL